MHLHWERSHNTAGDCNIRSLSWMGRVPDEIPQDEGWKLNRNHYYQEGWLSTANLRGVVGVTYTTSHCGIDGASQLVPPTRTNYNLRGHRAEVTLVRWNEPYQKLASCDTSGIIFVWIKYEGRWSIELINDRNTPVICFSWSHDGRMALICYQDGFVLVGSVAGQRYWSTMLPDVNNITSGVWTPDDQHVYLGTTQGDILVMDLHGNMVGKSNMKPGVAITEMAWNCERFNMEEQTGNDSNNGVAGGGQNLNIFPPSSNNAQPKQPQPYLRPDGRPFVMAACFKNGDIHLVRSYDDVIPQVLHTGFQSYYVDWTNSGELLAVAGKSREIAVKSNHTIRYVNDLHFYNDSGLLVYRIPIPCHTFPVSAVTWGHNDKRLFVATGNEIHIGWVSSSIGSLQLLSRLKIHNTLKRPDQVESLPLPCRLQNLIGMLFTQTIRCCIPNPENLRNFVIKPQLPENTRLHCTMIRHSDKSLEKNGSSLEKGGANTTKPESTTSSNGQNNNPTSAYTLYLEHLGGFLPLLKGKRMSKIRPEFIIYDPQLQEDKDGKCSWHHVPNMNFHLKRLNNGLLQDMNNSEAETTDDETSSPSHRTSGAGAGRRRRNRRRTNVGRYGFVSHEPIDYMNILPEDNRLAEVSSNIWGTKFKILGVNLDHVPSLLGQINYKASLLHLQPRQMRLEIMDLKEDNSDLDLDVDADDESWLEDKSDCEEDKRSRSGSTGLFISDTEEDTSLDNKAVTMKDDILTACVTSQQQTPSAPNVAPIAPLPSRLSFCLSPQRQHQLDAMIEHHQKTSVVIESSQERSPPPEILSPNKKFGGESGVGVGGCAISSMVAVKRSPTVAPSVVPRLLAKSGTACAAAIEMVEAELIAPESPAKRKLRMSVSCDNYLGDGKFSLSRRDSVGSGSPHSSKGSPLRWAAKADEIGMTSSVTSACSPLKDSECTMEQISSHQQKQQRSCSANQLDAIVDILGVPSELLNQKDYSNKRLTLLKDKKSHQNSSNGAVLRRRPKRSRNRNRPPPLENASKSKSYEEEDSVSQEKKEAQDLLVEVKRRSIYAKDCRGRTEAQACKKCQVIAAEVQDMELNREIFDIDDHPDEITEENFPVQIQDSEQKEEEEEIIQVIEEDLEEDQKGPEMDPEEVQTVQKKDKRRFDSVRHLLEKARVKLMNSKQFWSRSLSRGNRSRSAKPNSKDLLSVPTKETTGGIQSQSSPNTPETLRKEKRHRSFSPVRSFLNSPLIRRRNKKPVDPDPKTESTEVKSLLDSDSDDDTPPEGGVGASKTDSGFTNLESFQKKILRQKLKKLNQNPSILTTGPYPSPPPAPQRVPHPPRKNLQHATGLLQPSTPLLPRRALRKGPLGHPGATPTSTPNPTPNTKRRGLNALLQQYHQNQVHVSDAERKESLLMNKKRRRLILHNKAPIWNEASQVYQLDFGGRVTQESAKNFQIEYRGKQVMQFGRIDHNAYTLDFQYPFTAVQAFAVALANVTQRLK